MSLLEVRGTNLLWVLAAGLLMTGACSGLVKSTDPATSDGVGTVVLALSAVPTDVHCVRVVVTGSERYP